METWPLTKGKKAKYNMSDLLHYIQLLLQRDKLCNNSGNKIIQNASDKVYCSL